MRTFIAFEFDEDTKKFISDKQNSVKTKSIKGRFKSKDNFHITLKFLGETNLETIENIYIDMKEKFKNVNSVKAELSGIGRFGNEKIVRTIYINVKDDASIKKYAEDIDEITNYYHFKKNSNFKSHITIAQDVNLKCSFEEIQQENNFNYEVYFDKIYIIKSEQIYGKRIYTPIKCIKLN